MRKANLTNHIQVARDGAEALEFIFCEGAHAGTQNRERPESDPARPETAEGRRAGGAASASRPTRAPKLIPVVVLTSRRNRTTWSESYHLGVNSYIVKPVNFEQFVEAVQQLGMYWLLLNQPPKLKILDGANHFKVLIVEDNPADAELLLRELRRTGFEPDWQRVDTEADFLAGIGWIAGHHSLGLLDAAIQRPARAELLKESELDIPFIIVSGTIGEEMAVEAMQQGAADYLLKDRMARLGASVEQALEQKGMREERKKADQEIRSQLHELQRWHEAMLGREERILELKTEVNDLLTQLGKPPRYSTPPIP